MEEPEIVECSKCKSAAFTEIITFAKVSALMSQNGKSGIAPISSTFICMNCGTDISETDAIKEISEEKSPLII